MPCPECGAPCYYRNPMPSTHKSRDYDYSYAKCIGRKEREGWATTKSGERKWRIKYKTKPCGWDDGVAKPTAIVGEPPLDEEEVIEQRHTDVRVSAGRLVLKDYREGSKP